MIRAAALLTTLALTATACTLYIGTDDDDGHVYGQPGQDAGPAPDDAGSWSDDDAWPPYGDAGASDHDAWPSYGDAGLQDDAQPSPQDACGVP